MNASIQAGLTLSDIENALFFIIFLRFLILAIRYNLKTSFYITCIGLFAGYLWYKHLIDILSLYRNVLLRVPLLTGLGEDAINMRFTRRKMNIQDVITIKVDDSNSGIIQEIQYYIDPISMFVSNLKEPYKSKIWPFYYQIYNEIIPNIFSIGTKFWTQISGLLGYAFITRIGKKYCPYLIRWHWTFLLILGLVERSLIFFVTRMVYFQTFFLFPKASVSEASVGLLIKIYGINFFIAFFLLSHLGFIIFGLFHAIWGQYFYVPFLVENTELHIGPRPKNSIYSGGQTAWQYSDKINKDKGFSRFWFGWFGHGSNSHPFDRQEKRKKIRKKIKRFIRRLLKRIKK